MIVDIQADIARLTALGWMRALLKDYTTGGRILWGTDAYAELGAAYARDAEMSPELLHVVEARSCKARGAQTARTRARAEVFTPLWICRKMNDHIEAEWSRRRHKWTATVDSRRLEITCGEAPFLASRYDAASGEIIARAERCGLLDRKLRLVEESAEGEGEFLKWTLRAFQAIYGYEFQGDNLLIARVNLLVTYEEALSARLGRMPTAQEYKAVIEVIARNLWQMDGLTGAVPYTQAEPVEEVHQVQLYELEGMEMYRPAPKSKDLCDIYNWRQRRRHKYLYHRIGGRCGMKFDFIIGNPPYQEEQNSHDIDSSKKNFAPPVYHKFMDASYAISDHVLLIHPARFLFNAGSTPKSWNEKMLQDEHFAIVTYYDNCQDVFANTDIKGGIVISYHDCDRVLGAIQVFTKYNEFNSIIHKITKNDDYQSLDGIVYSRTSFRLTKKFHEDHPKASEFLSEGHLYDMSSNIFLRIPFAFHDAPPNDGYTYVRVLGRDESGRVFKYIRSDYINEGRNRGGFKVFVPQAYGRGDFGETISSMVIGEPNTASTETFLSIGNFRTKEEAVNVERYLKTKIARSMLGIMKVTQIANKPVYQYIPLQTFTPPEKLTISTGLFPFPRSTVSSMRSTA